MKKVTWYEHEIADDKALGALNEEQVSKVSGGFNPWSRCSSMKQGSAMHKNCMSQANREWQNWWQQTGYGVW